MNIKPMPSNWMPLYTTLRDKYGTLIQKTVQHTPDGPIEIIYPIPGEDTSLTYDKIVNMARGVELVIGDEPFIPADDSMDNLVRFARYLASVVAAEEREACAKLCEDRQLQFTAEEIRARAIND